VLSPHGDLSVTYHHNFPTHKAISKCLSTCQGTLLVAFNQMDMACTMCRVKKMHAKFWLVKLIQVDCLWNQRKIILGKGCSGRSYSDVKWIELA
jgi:hypothetical protein